MKRLCGVSHSLGVFQVCFQNPNLSSMCPFSPKNLPIVDSATNPRAAAVVVSLKHSPSPSIRRETEEGC